MAKMKMERKLGPSVSWGRLFQAGNRSKGMGSNSESWNRQKGKDKKRSSRPLEF